MKGLSTDLALLAGDGRVPGFAFAHLTLESRVLRFLVLVDDALHRPVLRQIMGSAFIEVDSLLANRTGKAKGTAGRRKASVSGRADIASGSRARRRAAAHHP